MRQSRVLVTKGIILNKKKFRESSLICDLFSPIMGKICILAKGSQKANSKSFGMLQTGAEVETELHHNQNSQWYILKKADLVTVHSSKNYDTVSYQQAGLEIFSQMIVDDNETEYYYSLLKNYLEYTKKLKRNAAAIFWRLLLRIMQKNGISIDWNTCQNCGKVVSSNIYFSFSEHGMICENCLKNINSSDNFLIDDELLKIFKILPEIGNHIETLSINDKTAKAMNKLLITHLNYYFDQHFFIKSIT